MLAGRTLQGIRPLEGIRAHDLHLPPIIGLGAEDRNLPISEPIGKGMFDDRSNLCLQTGISRVLHLHRNRHTARKYHRVPSYRKPRAPAQGFPSAEPPQAEYDRALWRY
jgi:hypothetical protein